MKEWVRDNYASYADGDVNPSGGGSISDEVPRDGTYYGDDGPLDLRIAERSAAPPS